MVPSNLLGCPISLIITLDIRLLLCRSFLMLLGFKEKKATSDPEIRAEAAINITKITKPTMVSVVNGKNVT